MGFFQTPYGPNYSNTSVNKVVSLTVEDFVSQSTGGFIATVSHGLETKALIVNAYGEDGKSILGCVTLKDNNTLEIYNEVAINCTVVIK